MSIVKIQGHASGTGTLTVTAPNTSTNRTITLPDTTGTLLDENSSVPAANLTGTVANARFPATLPAASGANLTNLVTTLASSTDATVSASDPAADTNPSATGHLWVNKSSGECYVCTDITTGENVWTNIGDGTGNIPVFTIATGGTITTNGDYKVHTFTSSGDFVVTDSGEPVEYLVIAGGGAGCAGHSGGGSGAGGGAGGYRTATGFSVSSQTYAIVVGAGATGVNSGTTGADGSNSSFSTITSTGGGGGALGGGSNTDGRDGGSGGGGGSNNGTGGSGNTPSTSPSQGNNGGNGNGSAGPNYSGAGGGGAGAVGDHATSTKGGDGGDGSSSAITGSAVVRAGGGAGGVYDNGTAASGGTGGGGNSPSNGNGTAGTVNTGSGGGGGSWSSGSAAVGGNGGSGVVILRYKFQ